MTFYPFSVIKNFLPPLSSLVLSIGFAPSATAQIYPKANAKRAFAHSAAAGRGKAKNARFRRENNMRSTIDLNPRSPKKTKTVKAPKHYKFAKGA